MRNVASEFYSDTLRKLVSEGVISLSDKVVVVCGGPLDQEVMTRVGFIDFVVTGLDWTVNQNAENLSYPDHSFDVAIVHAGLHHCYSPHRALLEMYRVARKAVIGFEARDSIMIRTAVRLGLTVDYEVDSAENGKGGVADTGIPNFIYRWTERELYKTVATFDPIRTPTMRYFYELRVPVQRLSKSGNIALRLVSRIAEPFSRLFTLMAPKQCNEFAFVALKNGETSPWLKA